MSALIISMIIAAAICGTMWRRPDARAAVSGAWQAGKSQAVREFRDGYHFAQSRLRAGDPSWKNPRRWMSWGLAGAYGTCKTVAAANRIRRRAWEGGRARYREWKAAQPVEAEVVAEVVETPTPDPRRDMPPDIVHATCPRCGAPVKGEMHPDEDKLSVPCPCGYRIEFVRRMPEDPPEEPKPEQPAEPAEQDKDPEPTGSADTETPGAEQAPQPEGTDMAATEATGLTSYATAHQEFASELRNQMSGSESLAASMAGILAEHSDLIGDTAVLQDLLNQAAGVADRIAQRSLEVANN